MLYDYGKSDYVWGSYNQIEHWGDFTVESDHLHLNTTSCDVSGFSTVSGNIPISTTTKLENLSNVDNYSEIVLHVDTHGLALYTYFHLGVAFSTNRWALLTSLTTTGDNYVIASVDSSNRTTIDGIQEVILPISDTFKTQYKYVYNNTDGSDGPMYCCIRAYWKNNEGEDYDDWYYKELDVYGIYLR